MNVFISDLLLHVFANIHSLLADSSLYCIKVVWLIGANRLLLLTYIQNKEFGVIAHTKLVFLLKNALYLPPSIMK